MRPLEHDTSALGTGDAERLALEIYGVEGRARRLPSYADCNFHLNAEVGEFVLKVAHAQEELAALEGQTAVLEHLAARA